jgi:signal transduction histidine kinase
MTLAVTAVVAVALGVAAAALLWLLSNQLVAAEAGAVLRARDIAGLAEGGQLPSTLSFPGEDTGVTQVVDASGAVIASTPNVEGEAPIVHETLTPGQLRSHIAGGLSVAGKSRFVIVSLGASSPIGPVTVHTASSLGAADQTRGTIAFALLIGYPALLVVVALSARHAIGRSLVPVEAIRAEVADIGDQDLDRRVPEPGSGDEIDHLAKTMNTMLGRLEQSAVRQRRFVADASHELRNPIASLRTVLEVAAAHPETATLNATVDDALADTYRLERLVADLLTLARFDDPDGDTRRREVDLVAICQNFSPSFRAASDATAPTVERRMPAVAWIVADPVVARGAITNLIENAMRHAKSRVMITIGQDDGRFALHVDDDGDGIAPDDRARVFERFTRLDDARTRNDGGSGLGLAIVQEFARSQGGNVDITANALGGARFTLTIDATATDP